MLLHIYNQRNTAYSKWKIASERINISLPLEMAADGLAARCRRTSVRCGSKSGAIPASCGSGGQPACPAPRLLFPSKIRSGDFRRFQPSPGQGGSNPVKPSQALACHTALPDPRPETPDPKGGSSRVKVSQAWSCRPAPQTQDPKPRTRWSVKAGQTFETGLTMSVKANQDNDSLSRHLAL